MNICLDYPYLDNMEIMTMVQKRSFGMRKIFLVIAIAAMVCAGVFAQSKESSGGGFNIMSYPPPVEGGNILLDAGIGLIRGAGGYDLKFPPLFLQVEYALPVGVPISVGGMFSVYSFGYDRSYGNNKYEYRWTELVIAARGNWHWGFNVNWLDVYTGLSLGYDISIYSAKYNGQSLNNASGASYGGFYWGFQAGAHFYFTKTIGMVVETGYPYFLKAGVAVKF